MIYSRDDSIVSITPTTAWNPYPVGAPGWD